MRSAQPQCAYQRSADEGGGNLNPKGEKKNPKPCAPRSRSARIREVRMLYMCSHSTIYVSSYYCICVLILRYVCLHTTECILQVFPSTKKRVLTCLDFFFVLIFFAGLPLRTRSSSSRKSLRLLMKKSTISRHAPKP